MWTAALTAAPVLAALELRAEHRALPRQIYLFKPLTTACILLIAATTPVPVSPVYRATIMAGLLCSLSGDVFLMLPRDAFLAGLASFLLAHLCYIAAFVSLAGVPGSAAAAVVLAAYGIYLLARLWPRLGKYRAPVVVYAVVLLSMAAAAYQQLESEPGLRAGLALGGAILFVISDSILALDRFELGARPGAVVVPRAPTAERRPGAVVIPRPSAAARRRRAPTCERRRRQTLVLGTYFTAQWLIATSVARL